MKQIQKMDQLRPFSRNKQKGHKTSMQLEDEVRLTNEKSRDQRETHASSYGGRSRT